MREGEGQETAALLWWAKPSQSHHVPQWAHSNRKPSHACGCLSCVCQAGWTWRQCVGKANWGTVSTHPGIFPRECFTAAATLRKAEGPGVSGPHSLLPTGQTKRCQSLYCHLSSLRSELKRKLKKIVHALRSSRISARDRGEYGLFEGHGTHITWDTLPQLSSLGKIVFISKLISYSIDRIKILEITTKKAEIK